MDLPDTTSASAAGVHASTAPAANLSFRLLWVDEVSNDEVWGLSAAPIDPLSA